MDDLFGIKKVGGSLLYYSEDAMMVDFVNGMSKEQSEDIFPWLVRFSGMDASTIQLSILPEWKLCQYSTFLCTGTLSLFANTSVLHILCHQSQESCTISHSFHYFLLHLHHSTTQLSTLAQIF